MKKLFLWTLLLCLAASAAAFGQKRSLALKPAPKATPNKTTPKKRAAATTPAAQPVVEIEDTEWKAISDAMKREDWTQSALLSSLAIGRLKTDNEKRQLAQLRYFYIFSLAGDASKGKLPYTELERVAKSYVGKEFVMPSRQILTDCKSKVNYICPVEGTDKALRVTATDRIALAIHSFEYIQLPEKVDLDENNGKLAFLGGTLQTAEVNSYKDNLKIIRLTFDKGFVNMVSNP